MTEESHLLTVDQAARLHPADLADQLQRLPDEHARELLRALPAAHAGPALVEFEPDRLRDLLEEIPAEKLAALLTHVPPESAADLVQLLEPAPRRRDTLAALPPEFATRVRSLLRHPEDSAGGIMTNRFIALHETMTVGDVREILRGEVETEGRQDIAYLYVTDDTQKLVGILGLRDLAFRRDDRRLAEIIQRDVTALRVTDDQEAISQRFERYHFLALPVVDEAGRLVGVVNASDALEIASEEATEDMQLMVGLSGEERALTPWTRSLQRRLPWLCVNLVSAFAAASVIGFHEETIAQWTALAAFLPIIAGQGGNAGMQTLTVIIRDLALGGLSPGDGRRALVKELIVGLANGLAIGAIVGLVGWWWQGSLVLGVVAASAMLLNMIVAALAGVLIPLGLKTCRLDPALASSIFLTSVTDVGGFLIFLALASVGMNYVT